MDERVMVRELRRKRSLAELSSGRALKRSAHPRMNGICSKDESKDSLRGLDKSTMTHAGRKRGKSYCADGLTSEPGDLTRALEKRENFFLNDSCTIEGTALSTRLRRIVESRVDSMAKQFEAEIETTLRNTV